MKKLVIKFNGVALAAGLLLAGSAIAQTISSGDYQTGKSRIKSEYSAEKKTCSALTGNAKDICVAQAKGKENQAQAELTDSYKPTLKTHYKVQIAKAEAIYDVARQKCNDLSGNPKDVCIKEAKAALIAAKADASVQMKTAAANEKTASAKARASSEKTEIRNDASAEKREAQYKVEKEKCDAFTGSSKDKCMTEAKARFGKP